MYDSNSFTIYIISLTPIWKYGWNRIMMSESAPPTTEEEELAMEANRPKVRNQGGPSWYHFNFLYLLTAISTASSMPQVGDAWERGPSATIRIETRASAGVNTATLKSESHAARAKLIPSDR